MPGELSAGANVNHKQSSSLQTVGGAKAKNAADTAACGEPGCREVLRVPILSLQPGDSPRLEGEDKAHIAWLAETEAALPPILVDRRNMRVIDGMHRLLAASLRGREWIEVQFFDDSPAEAFRRAVEANVTHGLPLTQADRRAAAKRIVVSHPHLSDRAIGESTGLAARTVAGIRRRTADVARPNARVGRDGRVRPLDGAPAGSEPPS